MLRRWGIKTHKSGFTNRVDKFAIVKNSKVDVSIASSNSSDRIRSDEGLTLETAAFEFRHGGKFTLSTQLINPKFCFLTSFYLLWQ